LLGRATKGILLAELNALWLKHVVAHFPYRLMQDMTPLGEVFRMWRRRD
jgi:hypothetical protein